MAACGRVHNIMILENHLSMGGIEKKLYDFVSRIDRAHYRVVMCCLKEAGYFKQAFVDLGLPFYEGLLRHKYDAPAYRRLLRVIAAEKIELIYTLPHPNSVIFSSVARRTGRVRRTVVSVHGTGGPTGGRMVRAYLKPFFGGVDRFIAVAEAHKRYLVSSEDLPPERTVVIYNGVDVEKYRPGAPESGGVLEGGRARGGAPDPAIRRSLGIPDGARVAVTVSSLNRYKGIDVLLSAGPEIVQGRDDVRMVIVGGGPEHAALTRQAAELGLADRVVFTGLRPDVDAILRAGDVFVLPSRTEAFPNVILEAMATALPVVATDVGSVRELVEEGKTGYLVPPEDPRALGEKVISLLENPARARELGEAGRRVVETRYRLEGMCEEREKLFAELLCG